MQEWFGRSHLRNVNFSKQIFSTWETQYSLEIKEYVLDH